MELAFRRPASSATLASVSKAGEHRMKHSRAMSTLTSALKCVRIALTIRKFNATTRQDLLFVVRARQVTPAMDTPVSMLMNVK